jgi:hypothetical protein
VNFSGIGITFLGFVHFLDEDAESRVQKMYKAEASVKKIFVHNGGFGDNLWVEPVVRHFLSKKEEVLIITPHPCIFENYPNNHLYINRFDKVFPLLEKPVFLKFEEKPCMHYLECFCRQAKIAHIKLNEPELHLSKIEKERQIQRRYAVFHLETSEQLPYRKVYGVDWKKVVQYVRSIGLEPVQISEKDQNLIAPWFRTRNFRHIMALIYNCDLFIGFDSGPSHIAASFHIPSVIFFGSVNPQFRQLNHDQKIYMQNPCLFPHCYHEVHDARGQPCRLVKGKTPPPCCIHDSENVITAISQLFNRSGV